jgi:hypothetical protein
LAFFFRRLHVADFRTKEVRASLLEGFSRGGTSAKYFSKSPRVSAMRARLNVRTSSGSSSSRFRHFSHQQPSGIGGKETLGGLERWFSPRGQDMAFLLSRIGLIRPRSEMIKIKNQIKSAFRQHRARRYTHNTERSYRPDYTRSLIWVLSASCCCFGTTE